MMDAAAPGFEGFADLLPMNRFRGFFADEIVSEIFGVDASAI